jgi:F-box domain
MRSSSTFRSLLEDPPSANVAPPPTSLRNRLRIASSSSAAAASKHSQKPVRTVVPFRRRTESVSTVLSTSSTQNGMEQSAGEIVAVAVVEDNLLQWLEEDCPSDVLPKILAYCGPQQVAALAKTNRSWQARIVGQEPLWRVLCEELYKVRSNNGLVCLRFDDPSQPLMCIPL